MAPKEQLQPIYAEIVEEHDTHTKARLMLFGEVVPMTFSNVDHREAADTWVAKWNKHLGIEWMRVRDTAATMMEGYTQALLSRGVLQGTLDAALRNIKADVKG